MWVPSGCYHDPRAAAQMVTHYQTKVLANLFPEAENAASASVRDAGDAAPSCSAEVAELPRQARSEACTSAATEVTRGEVLEVDTVTSMPPFFIGASAADSDSDKEDGNDHGGCEGSKSPEHRHELLVSTARKRKLRQAVTDMDDVQQMEEELAGSVPSCKKAANEKPASDHDDADDADDSDDEAQTCPSSSSYVSKGLEDPHPFCGCFTTCLVLRRVH
ncbi:hypothetical protein CYMTET_52574 [Cymbomonas tetramitiformis]|uniref:Uncharacterized protein n=1 Tax=Cymbomonas tetramitiformis TaxID=36881 RepID=A0AAE0BIR2_9CHLO|nr:hypothetical protein CYMTET_52574 [Cymbomonas tetramitiformis]